jgi:hypothetical protein
MTRAVFPPWNGERWLMHQRNTIEH